MVEEGVKVRRGGVRGGEAAFAIELMAAASVVQLPAVEWEIKSDWKQFGNAQNQWLNKGNPKIPKFHIFIAHYHHHYHYRCCFVN